MFGNSGPSLMFRVSCISGFQGFRTSFLIIKISLMNPHKVRKDCKYNEGELSSILPFKSDFISSTTHERMVILKRKILPSLFNHWLEKGKEYDSEESKLLSKVVYY